MFCLSCLKSAARRLTSSITTSNQHMQIHPNFAYNKYSSFSKYKKRCCKVNLWESNSVSNGA